MSCSPFPPPVTPSVTYRHPLSSDRPTSPSDVPATNVYRMLGAYAAYDPDDPNFAIRFLFDWERWDAYAFPIILGVLTWVGDILVIYRCFLIWQRNYYIVVLPVLLLLASIGTTSVNLWWFRHTTSIPWPVMSRLFKITYPLNFAQNVLTTGCIAYRIYMQYRVSKAAFAVPTGGGGANPSGGINPSGGAGGSTGVGGREGAREGAREGTPKRPGATNNKLNFIAVMRIIVESALIYTVQMFLLILFWYTGSPAVVIVQHAITPSIGIVFVLIAIRTHVAKTSMGIQGSRSGSFSIMPTWLSGDDRTINNRGAIRTTQEGEEEEEGAVQLEFVNHHHGHRYPRTPSTHHANRKSIIEFAPPTPGLYDDYYAKV
ncbi:hypothetical protein MD484_g7964, partial [Candolleomyces efflorescens]